MNTPYVFKRCTKCGEWLVACKVNFGKHKKCKYGLHSQCKKCLAEHRKKHCEENRKYSKKYYEKNREYYKQYRDENEEHYKQLREKNREKNKEYKKKWREAKKEHIKQWYEKNRDKIREQQKQYNATPQGQALLFNRQCKRRTREQNQGKGITKEQWLEMMQYFDWKCAYSEQVLSKDTRSLDHIKPLNQGGEHEIWNVVPMYGSYNFSKHDKDMLQWYKEQDFFSEERLQKIYEWQEYAYNKWHKNEIVK